MVPNPRYFDKHRTDRKLSRRQPSSSAGWAVDFQMKRHNEPMSRNKMPAGLNCNIFRPDQRIAPHYLSDDRKRHASLSLPPCYPSGWHQIRGAVALAGAGLSGLPAGSANARTDCRSVIPPTGPRPSRQCRQRRRAAGARQDHPRRLRRSARIVARPSRRWMCCWRMRKIAYPALQPGQPSSQLVSAVNGAFGDYLFAQPQSTGAANGFLHSWPATAD